MVGIWSIGQEEWSDGGREREGGMEDERETRGVEVEEEGGSVSNSTQNPSPVEKNKWLEGTICLCLSALPVSPERTDL